MAKKQTLPPVEILWFHALVGERVKECDLLDTLESLVECVKEHPDAKHRYVSSVDIGDLDICMFDRMDIGSSTDRPATSSRVLPTSATQSAPTTSRRTVKLDAIRHYNKVHHPSYLRRR